MRFTKKGNEHGSFFQTHKCSIKPEDSGAAMEATSVLRIFEKSIKNSIFGTWHDFLVKIRNVN